MKQRTVKIGMVILMVLSVLGWSSAAWAGIGIRGGESGSQGDFQVSFEPVKPVFNVGENIKFRVKGNKTFYLYLFSVDADRNEGYVLLPNIKQQYNKYQADREYDVPEQYIEFYSDSPGTEKVIMLASTEKLEVDMNRLTEKGDFYTADAAGVEELAKSLRVRSREGEGQQVTREMALIVTGKGQDNDRRDVSGGTDRRPPADADDPGISAFISTNKPEYRVGETMVITYGADKEGFVHLYSVEPDGKRVFLKTQPVSGNEFYQVKARAMEPAGAHQLMAIYDKDREQKQAPSQTDESGQQTKAIDLIDDQPESYAVYHLMVRQ